MVMLTLLGIAWGGYLFLTDMKTSIAADHAVVLGHEARIARLENDGANARLSEQIGQLSREVSEMHGEIIMMLPVRQHGEVAPSTNGGD
jgi:hypothetical protein